MNINELKQIVKHCTALNIKTLLQLNIYKVVNGITNNNDLINKLNIDFINLA